MEKELRILILEDVPADAELEAHELRRAGLVFTSRVVETEDAFLKALEEYFPDIILADYDLPAFDGLEALKIAKEKCPEVPFILVTGRVGEEFAIETLKKGVADYVMKGNLKRLVPAISRAIYDAKLIIQRKQSEEKFRLLAEQSPNMIFINYRGRVVYANQKCEEIMGYTRDEFYSESFDFRNLIAPEYHDLVSSSFQKHMQGEEVLPYEYAILSKDGKRIEVIITTKLIDYENEKAILGTITDITGRKQAEEIIHLEMKFTETLLNSLPGLFYLYELDPQSPANSRLIRFNRKHSTLTGYTPEELKGMTIKDWFEPDMLAKVVRVIRLIGKRREAQANLRLRMKDGSEVPYAFTGRLLKIHDKVYFLGMGIDISDLVSAQQALQESEEKHRLVVENAHDAILILQDGKIKFHNHQSITLSGYSAEEIQGVPFATFIHTDDKDMVMGMHRKRLLGENIPASYSFRFINKRGETIWVLVTGTLITWEGHPAALVFLRDITERKLAEEQVKRLYESMGLAMEASKAGTWDWDITNNTFIWSPEFLKLFGMPPDTVAGFEAWRNSLHPEDREIAAKRIQDSINDKTELTNDYRIILPNQEIRWIRAIGRTFYDKNTPMRMTGLCIDITELKRLERELTDKIESLEYWNKMFFDREQKMIELKKEVNLLLEQLDQPKKYMW